MDSSNKDLTRSKPRDMYSHIPQHGSGARSPKGREEPRQGISGEFKQLDISSNDDAPSEEFFTDDPEDDHYSDISLERDIFGGRTYKEFDHEFRYQHKVLYGSSENKVYESQYNAFKAFPGSKTRNNVYLQQVKSVNQFNRWVHCLIGQLKLAGLREFIPTKDNNWSARIIANDELSNSIAYIWENCVEEKNCPKWVDLTPYNAEASPKGVVFNLLRKYDKLNKNLDVVRETIRHTDSGKLSSDLYSVWIQCTEMYYNFFMDEKCNDINSIKKCLDQMIVRSLADKSYLVRQELRRNNDLDIPAALDLINNEVFLNKDTEPVKQKSEDKESRNNYKSSWKKAANGSKKSHKLGNYNRRANTKKIEGKTNYVQMKSSANDTDDKTNEDENLFLRPNQL